MNFGTAGVVVIFIVFGALLARLDCVNLLSHPYVLIFAGAMLWPFMRTVRNDFSNFMKPLGFIFIILLIWTAITIIVPIARRGGRVRPQRSNA